MWQYGIKITNKVHNCKIKLTFSALDYFKTIFSWVTFIADIFLNIRLQKYAFWVDCVVLLLSNLILKTIWVLNLSVPEVHISLQLLGALQSGADAGAGLCNCGKGGMRAEVNERESARQAGQEGAQDISTGRVKKLQGWRSDQTGLRRPQGRPWGKFTGTLIYFKNVFICRWLFRIFTGLWWTS